MREKTHYFSGGMNPVLQIYKIFPVFSTFRRIFDTGQLFIVMK